jgi:predicted MFS family arabinose efflux permease
MKGRLSVMMFLEFFIWGAWLPLIFGYLPAMGFTPLQQSLILITFNVAALVALFFGTQFADRNFAAEKFLAFSHLVGGGAILALFFLQAPLGTAVNNFNSVVIEAKGDTDKQGVGYLADGTKVVVDGVDVKWAEFEELDKEKRPVVLFLVTDTKTDAAGKAVLYADANAPRAPFWPFFLLMLVHSLFYVPTISITNSIAFANLKDAQKEFGPVRLWGTIGWIAASWPFVFMLVDWAQVPAFGTVSFTDWLGKALGTPLGGAAKAVGDRYIFLAAGGASLLLAVFSFLLPHTPPKPATAGRESLAWVEALRLLRHPFILVLFVVTFLDAAIHQYYFVWTGRYLEAVGIPGNWVMPVMSIGQIAEILTMLFLGYVLKTLGWRYTMIVGILGHAARFAVFAFLPNPYLAVAANLLHGICYAFFFATVYIFVDEYFPKDARSSAQGLFNALILGLGPIATNFVAPWLGDRMKLANGAVDYRGVFLVPLVAAVSAAILLLLFFHPPRKREESELDRPPSDAGGEKWVKEHPEGIKTTGEIVRG